MQTAYLINIAIPLRGARVALLSRNAHSARVRLLESRGSYNELDEITVLHSEIAWDEPHPVEPCDDEESDEDEP